jgi:hypothetical protein
MNETSCTCFYCLQYQSLCFMARYVPAKENGRPGSFVLIWQVYGLLCGRIGGRVIHETGGYVKSVVDTTNYFVLLYLWMILSLTHSERFKVGQHRCASRPLVT